MYYSVFGRVVVFNLYSQEMTNQQNYFIEFLFKVINLSLIGYLKLATKMNV